MKRKKKADFKIHYWIPVITASENNCSKLMELHVHKEKNGVRVRLTCGKQKTWWEYLEIK